MGSICQKPQKISETQNNLDQQPYLPISIEKKPNNIHQSLKHNLEAKYQDMECILCEKPQQKEVGIQTSITFYNLSNFDKIREEKQAISKQRRSPKKYKKGSKSERTESLQKKKDSYKETHQTSLSQTKKKKIDQIEYIVLINSQKDQNLTSSEKFRGNGKQFRDDASKYAFQ